MNSPPKVSQEDWGYIKEKFESLFYFISYRLTGDNAICDMEDNMQDFYITTINAIEGFEAQGTNGEPKDFIRTEDFAAYLKTCLWYFKAKKGKRVSFISDKRKGEISLHGSDKKEGGEYRGATEIEDPKSSGVVYEEEKFLEELANSLKGRAGKLLKIIAQYPDVYMDSGHLNISRLAKYCNISELDINKSLKFIGKFLNSGE